MKAEADRLADALHRFRANTPVWAGEDREQLDQAIALLRRWPDGEPVGHLHSNGDFCQDRPLDSLAWPVPLYTAPPAKPDGEPVAWQRRENDPDERQWVEISKWEYDNCTPHDRRRELFAAPPAESERIAALEAALGELVALKDLKERIEAADASTYSLSDASAAQALADEYDRRKAPAWQAARAALRAIGEVRK